MKISAFFRHAQTNYCPKLFTTAKVISIPITKIAALRTLADGVFGSIKRQKNDHITTTKQVRRTKNIAPIPIFKV